MKICKSFSGIVALAVAALGTMGMIPTAQGALIYVASIADNPNTGAGDPYQYEVGRWSSAATLKTFDIDGDNRYGTDGYFLANTANTGGQFAWNNTSHESAPSYTGGIAATGTPTGGVLNSGSHSNAEAALQESGTGLYNLGYTGIFDSVAPIGNIPHQSLFNYTMNRDMLAGETIRVGIMSGSLPDDRVGLTSLDLRVGTDIATATIVPNPTNGSIDMYFFDVSGLSNGDTIEIYGGKDLITRNDFQWATISAVTFDSVVIPEPSTLSLIGLGLGAMMIRRRRR